MCLLNKVNIFLTVSFLFLLTHSYTGVDVSQLYSKDTYKCMKNNGMHFAIIRGYHSYGAVDKNAITGLQNAKAAGLITDTYMFPCRSKDPVSQVDEMVSSISSSLYGMVWIDVETNSSPGCSWNGHSFESNCQFLESVVNRIRAKGKKVGIYASKYMWQGIFGSMTACPSVAQQTPLWYAHYDKKPSFSDFTPFGGWPKPTIKQYEGDVAFCGANVDKSYYP